MTFNEIRASVKAYRPLIHAITNPISITQCANTALATGARPIMAEHPGEVCEITQTSASILFNLGNITDTRMKSMMLTVKTANECNIPVTVDAVGAACSSLRREFLFKLINENHISLIKGNYSEILAIYDSSYKSSGVDAESTLGTDCVQNAAQALAKRYNTIILASGKCDIVTDGKRLFRIYNGSPALSSLTGTGCMLGMLCSCFLSVYPHIESVCAAAAMMGICGEKAQSAKGVGDFIIKLMDNLSALSDEDFEKSLRMEEREIESL